MALYNIISLDYVPNLQEFYLKLCDLPGFVLLESTDKTRGRYDILSALPYDIIRINEQNPKLKEELNALAQILSTENSDLDLPFQGGAIGYISYDLGERLYGLDATAQPSLSNMPLLELGLYDWALIADHHLKKLCLFAANRHHSTQTVIQQIVTRWNDPRTPSKDFKLKSDFVPLIDKSTYAESFADIQSALKSGRSYQVNYTQAFHAAYEGDPWSMYKRISSQNPVPFSAYLKTSNASILSFSPERFLLYEQGSMLTSPIKGTIARSSNLVEDKQLANQLSACPKNRAENVMIVDLLRNDLGKIAKTGSVKTSNLCSIHSFNSVHHMVSDIRAQCLETIVPFEAFLSCFPGGSITGAPKLEAMTIIRELEPYARGVYCGSIGYFSNHGRFDTNIAIRTLTAKDGVLHLAAGGGIVIDSQLEDEYRECYAKIAAIINGLKKRPD